MRVPIQQKIIKRKSYRVIIIGILLFQCTILSVDADPSQGRWGHASALINNRLYVYGGRTDLTAPPSTVDTSNINELIYLDVSKSFNPAEPPWVVKTSLLQLEDGNSVQPPSLAFHSCSFGGNQNELLILFGGQPKVQDPPIVPIDNSLFVYNTTTETWLIPSTTENAPRRRRSHTMVTSLSDSISYLWGGIPVGNGEDTNALTDLYKLTITDTILWTQLTSSDVGRSDHSATLVDGKMYIIGGALSGGELASMTIIPVYDTNTDLWTSQTATGTFIPDQRKEHRAVGKDTRIIIYGGTTGDDEKLDDIAELNIVDNILTWVKPQVIGTTPPGRFDHSMALVGSKAIVTFGFVDDFAGRNVFVFDTDSYTWETMYNVPAATTGVSETPTDAITTSGAGDKKNLGLIIGVSVSGGVIVLVLIGLLFFWIRRRKKQPSFAATPYEKQQASIPPIAGPAPLHNLNNYGPSQGGANGAPFIPPFATSSYQRRQSSFGSISETRNLTPVDQHDSWGSAPSNSSQSQLPQINPIHYHETYSPTTPKSTSPRLMTTSYLSSPTPPPQHHSNTPPTPPASTTPPPPQNPSAAAGASSSTKTSSSNLRLDSDSNTAPAGFDYNLPPVAPLSFNRTRTPSPSQTQQQQQHTPPRLPISTSTSSSQDSSNDLVSSPTEIEATETTTTSTEDEGGTSGSFNSPLFRTEALSALAGTAASASPTDRSFSLRSVPRLNSQSTPRNSTGLSSPPPILAAGRLRSSTLDGQHTYDGDVTGTGGSRPTSPIAPIDNNNSDNQSPRGRLFVANPDPSDDSD